MNDAAVMSAGAGDTARVGGYEVTRFNALRHGVLSRYMVLPWEEESEYRALLDAVVVEHQPCGPTEEHLVEELAGIIWRKRRLRLAEAAAFRRGLGEATEPYSKTVKAALVHLDDDDQETERVVDAIRASPADTADELEELAADEAMTARASTILKAGGQGAREKAVNALQEDTRKWWEDVLTWEPGDYEDGEEPFKANAASLIRFLETKVAPWYEARRKELENRPLIRAQAFGQALDPNRLRHLARYEVHLDRKLERTLAMLIRLCDLRRAAAPA